MPPSMDELLRVVRRLRTDCPWDRAQTPDSMRTYLLEESYEVVEAIEARNREALREELGDLLFNLCLVAESAGIPFDEVAEGITAKMIKRHPHVFRDGHREDDAGSVGAWEARKARERGLASSLLDDVPRALPALVRSHRVGEKVAQVGFDWPDVPSARAKVDEELRELDAATTEAERRDEYGDLLLAVANLGRLMGFGPEEALREANAKFEARFRVVERLASERGLRLHELSAEALDDLWREAKGKPRI